MLFFYIVYCNEIIWNETRLEITITPYGENVHSLTYWDKIWNLKGYFVKRFLQLRSYGMDTGFSGNNRNIVAKH